MAMSRRGVVPSAALHNALAVRFKLNTRASLSDMTTISSTSIRAAM